MGVPPITSILRHALSGAASRQRATASNIANADTPGFAPTHVDFESQIKASMQQGPKAMGLRTTDIKHISASPATAAGGILSSKSPLTERNDGSKVDIEQEVMVMADTEIRSAALTELLANQNHNLRTVITGGR